MKAGNYGLLSLGLLAASVAISIGYGDWLLSERSGVIPGRAGITALPRITPVPEAARELMGKLQPQLARLAIPKEPSDRRVDLRLVGYEPVRYPTGRGPGSGLAAGSDHFPIHTLSMAFVSARHSFCVIDDQFHAQGETLVDGSRIAQIRPGGVQLEWQGIREWLEVRNNIAEMVPQEDRSMTTTASP